MPDSEDFIPFNEAKRAIANFFSTPTRAQPDIEMAERAIVAMQKDDRPLDYKHDFQPLLEPFRGTGDYERLKAMMLRHLPVPLSSEREPATNLPERIVTHTVTQSKKARSRTTGEGKASINPRHLFADDNKHSQPSLSPFRYLSEADRLDTGDTFSNGAGRDFPGGAFIKRLEAGIGPKFYILLYKDLASTEYTPVQQNQLRNFVINSPSRLTPQALYEHAIDIGVKLPLYIVKGDFKKNRGLYMTSPENIRQTNFVQSKPESLQPAAALTLQVGKALVTDKDSCNEAALREGIAIEYAKLLGFNTSEGHFRLGNNDLILYATRQREGLISYAEATQPENTQPPKNLAQLRVLAMLLGDWDKVGSRKQNILFDTNELFVFDMDKSFDITEANKDNYLPHPFDLSPLPPKYSNFDVLNDPNNPSAYAETMLKLYLLSGKKLDPSVMTSYGPELQTWADTHCTLGKDNTGAFFQRILKDMSQHRVTAQYQAALAEKTNLFRHRVDTAIRQWTDAGVFNMTKAQYNCRVWKERGLLYQQAESLLRACRASNISIDQKNEKYQQLMVLIASTTLSHQELLALKKIHDAHTTDVFENPHHQAITQSLAKEIKDSDPFPEQLDSAIKWITCLTEPLRASKTDHTKKQVLTICLGKLTEAKRNLNKESIETTMNNWLMSNDLNQARGVGTCVKYLLISCISILTLGIYPLLIAVHHPALQAQFNQWARAQSMLCVLNPKTRTRQALDVAAEVLRTAPTADTAPAA